MGEVYRATDTKLKRQVALKLLPESLAGDRDRLARLQREAEVLASLNHPYIAAIYGLEDSDGAKALVMELVEGEDLALRISRGPIPLEEALTIARQIAEGLEAAHDQGIVHRDLKPANVRVRPDGTVKILDFGLAKSMSVDGAAVPPAALDDSPTLTSPGITQVGAILGSAPYMAPEQARGKVIDRRVDIWAFGCVLYEMLTARRPFSGDRMTDVLSAIVSREPDWPSLPAETPQAVHQLLHRCLDKDAHRRLRDIGEARLILENPHAADDLSPFAAPHRRSPAWLLPVLGTAAGALALAASLLLVNQSKTSPSDAPRVVTRYDVAPPDDAVLTLVFRPALALSADGSVMAFTAAANGVNRIYVRARSDVAARPIRGSEGGTNPALSPDGKWLAFFADGSVKKAPVDGQAMTIAPARDVRGMTWSDDGALILTSDAAAPLSRMTADGADARNITTLGPGERTHRWPQVLPGGRAALFTVGTLDSPDSYDGSNIDAVVISTGERRAVIRGAAMARYCGDGYLLYAKGAALFAVAFDTDRLTTTGSPVQVVQGVGRDASTGAAHFDCAGDRTLAMVPAASNDLRRFAWADRTGQMQLVDLAAGPYQEARISPDGTRMALLNGVSGSGDVWTYEFATAKYSRLTFTGTNAAPVWSADGRSVYYTSFARGGDQSTIMKKLADGSREAEGLATTGSRAYLDWVSDTERTAVFESVSRASDRGDILRIALGQDSAAPERLVATSFNEYAAAVSPNGRWLAYQSDDTGRYEVFVRDLAGSGARWQVTVEGGEEPHWGGDGHQLFYRSANRLMVVDIEPGETFRPGSRRALFDGIYNSGIESGRSYDVDPVTGRFLLVQPADAGVSAPNVRLVLNWDHGAALPPRRP
jgi:serine/threonine-protein kinase